MALLLSKHYTLLSSPCFSAGPFGIFSLAIQTTSLFSFLTFLYFSLCSAAGFLWKGVFSTRLWAPPQLSSWCVFPPPLCYNTKGA